MSGTPPQQQTSLTFPAGPVYTFRFTLVLIMCFVIIDPVQQPDAQMSHPFCHVSAVHELLCGVGVWLCHGTM